MALQAIEAGARELSGNEVFEKYKGKRWLLLAFCTLMMCAVGVCYAWSILSGPIGASFAEWNESTRGLIFTLFMYTYCIFGVIGGLLARKLNTVRINLLLAAVCMFSGFVLASFAQTPVLLIIGFSVLCGAGAVLTYNAVIVTVTEWFSDRPGVATGIVLMGYGMGAFILGNVYTAMLQNGMSWNTAFWITGAVIGVILLAGSFIAVTPPKGYRPPVYKPKQDRFPVETKEMSPLEMVQRGSFWLLFAMGCFSSMPGMVISGFGRQILQNIDPRIAAEFAALAVGSISIANGCGRVFTGFINDRFGMGFNIRVSASGVTFGTLLILIAVLMQSLAFTIAALLITGFCAGMSVPDGALVTRKLYGDKHYRVNLQIVMLSGFINSLSSTVFGGLYDVSGGFMLPLIVLTAIALVGSTSSFFIKKP